MKVNEVKGKMIARGITTPEMAKALGMSLSTFWRKMNNGGNSFNVGNLIVFKEVLDLNDQEAVDILISA